MTIVLSNESNLDFVNGGPFYRLQQRLGLMRDGLSIPRRIAWCIALTWVPLLILSVVQGRALGPTPRESFLLDFAAYGRFLIGLPLLIAAEAVVGPRLVSAAKLFARSGIVRAGDAGAFQTAIAGAIRWRDSAWAEGILLAVALVGSWTLNVENWYESGPLTWRVVPAAGGVRLSLAGLWFHAVAVPLVQFLLLRWLWKLVVWTRFLYSLSKLDLDVVPTHADAAGGLGFLGTAHSSLGILACAIGCPFFGDVAFRMLYEGAKLRQFEVPVAVYLLSCVLIFLSPPAVFFSTLARAKREGLRSYGLLVGAYNRAFHEKWVRQGPPESEALLGSSDIQSLADLGGVYDRIRQMRSLPFGRMTILQILGLALLPALPLVFLVVPIGEILKFLGKAIF
jgi:hypothetical protein